MAADLDELIKRDHTANVKNHRIRRLAPTSVPFNGIPSSKTENILLAYIAWGATLRSTFGIGLQKGGSHLTDKCATTLVLAGSNI